MIEAGSKESFWRITNPILWGIILSAIFFGVYFVLALQESCSLTGCATNWQRFLSSPPNEMGDTLAGLAGGLAFLWIIITVLLQSQELAAQRAELKLTRREFEKMSLAQGKQVELLIAQAAIFEDEQMQRREDRAERTLDESLNYIVTWLQDTTEKDAFLKWIFDLGIYFSFGFDKEPEMTKYDSAVEVDEFIHRMNKRFHEVLRSEEFEKQKGECLQKDGDAKNALYLLRIMGSALQLLDSLSEGQRIRLKAIKLQETKDMLETFVASHTKLLENNRIDS